MTIELSKYKDRDAVQMNEIGDLRQSNVLFERVNWKLLFLKFCFVFFSYRKNLIFKLKLILYVRN